MENMSAMLHAAEISPFITERTLGPDLPKWLDEENVENNWQEKKCDLQISPQQKCTKTEKVELSPSSIANMNLEAIKARLLIREASGVHKSELRELLRQVAEKRPVRQQSNSEYNKWLLAKKAADSKILQQAQDETYNEVQEYNIQVVALQQQTQAMVAQLQKKAAEAKKAQEEYILQQQKQQQQQQQLQLQKEKEEQQKQIQLQQQQQQQLQQQQLQKEYNEANALVTESNHLNQNASNNVSQMPQNTLVQQQQNLPPQHQTQKGTHDVTDSTTPERLNFLDSINSVYHKKIESTQALQRDEAAKGLEMIYKKAINVPVNAISAVSEQNLNDKFVRILSFFNGQPIPNTDISINSHPLGRDYCLLLMAKKFVSQADSAISSNPKAAFPFATMLVALWQHIPEFGATFLAHLYEESPFLLPRNIRPKPEQDPVSYLNVIGYRLIEGGALESHDDFLKRLTGMSRLYAAIMVTSGRKADAAQHPFGLQEAWRWLTNFIRLDPLPDISATILLEILQIVNADLWTAYRRQFTKLLFHIQHQYMQKLASASEGGPKSRLTLFLSDFLEKGQVTRPAGMLPPNFW